MLRISLIVTAISAIAFADVAAADPTRKLVGSQEELLSCAGIPAPQNGIG